MKCPVCDSEKTTIEYAKLPDFEYRVDYNPDFVRCDQCGLVRQEPIPAYEELPAFYPDDYLVYNQNFKKASDSLFAFLKKIFYGMRARTVKSYIGTKGNVLDVGCANGKFLTSMADIGDYKLYGLDFKNTGVDFESLGIDYREGTLESIDYPENHFDAVMMDNLIEHVPDLHPFMEKLKYIVKPGGYIFGTTPNYRCPSRLIFGQYWGGFHSPRHLYLFTPDNLAQLLARYDFHNASFPIMVNAGDWAVSLQNFFRRNDKKEGKYRRAKYFALVGILGTPTALLTSLFGVNGSMDFVAQLK